MSGVMTAVEGATTGVPFVDKIVLTKIILGGPKRLEEAAAAGVTSGRFLHDEDGALFAWLVQYAAEHGKTPTMDRVAAEFPKFTEDKRGENDPFSDTLAQFAKSVSRRVVVEGVREIARTTAANGGSIDHVPAMARALADEVEAVKQNGHARLRVTSSEDVEPEVVGWTWKHNGIGWIPSNGLTVLVGDPGEGKGLWGCWVASHATLGSRDFPQMRVGILGHEDSLGIQRARLDAAGSAPVVFLDTADDRFMTFPTDVGLLRTAIEQYSLNLVLVDPINNHLDSDIRTSDDKEMRRALSPLNKLGQELGVTIIAVTHMSKGTVGQRLLYRAGGSIAISGAARQMLFLGAKSDTEAEDFDPDERFLFVGKVNYSAKPLSPLKFRIEERMVDVGTDEFEGVAAMQFVGTDDSGVSIEDVFSPPRGRGRPQDDNLRQWIADQIEGKAEIESQVLEDAAHAAGRHGSWRTIRNVLRDEHGWTSHKVGARWVWRGRPSPFLKALPGGGEDVSE
jgi:hypothetical protein